MKPLSVILIFLVIVTPLIISMDARQDLADTNAKLHQQYTNDFQAAVDDAAAYLARFESQQVTTAIRYQREKQIEFDEDMLNVFYYNLALKYGIESNPVAIQNLKLHMPAMVMFRYNGYVLVTLEDAANPNGQHELKPVFWPVRPYTYSLQNGNILSFTLDDQAQVYDVRTNQFIEGSYDELRYQTDLSPLNDIHSFRQVRQKTVTDLVEKDLAGAINRHMELVKRMDLNIQFTLPKGLEEQSIKDVGFMAFVQGYPLPNGQKFEAFAFGGGQVVLRNAYVGTIAADNRRVAYGDKCVPANATIIETIYDPEEAVKKGYFIQDCFNP